MKHRIPIFLTIALIGACCSTGALAQDTSFNPLGRDVPTERMEKQMRIQIEWIELSHTDFTALMEEHNSGKANARKSSNDGPLRARLKKMIEEDEAEIIDSAVVLARSGQRAKVESILEVIYATEYDPPDALAVGEKPNDTLTLVPPNPTAFETRNVGTTLEVDPVLGADERTVDLSLSPELVYRVGDEEFGEFNVGGSEVIPRMPLFYTMKLTTQVAMIVGEYLFAGVQSPFDMETMKADRDRKVMVFLKTDLLYVGLPLKEDKKADKKAQKK